MTTATYLQKSLTSLLALALLAWAIATPGCVCQQVQESVSEAAAVHDGYARLIEATLDGTIDPLEGMAITAEDLAATPPSVRFLLQNLIQAVYTSRRAWHAADHGLNDADEPGELVWPILGEPR